MSDGELHSYVWCEVDSEAVETFHFCGGEVAVYSKKSPERIHSPNEDAACLIEVDSDRGVIAVADGVGGATAGDEASRCAVEFLVESCFELELDDTHGHRGLRVEILDGIESANLEIVGWCKNSATTLTAIEVDGARFRAFHIGDSGALLTSNRGNIKFATVGHSPVEQAVDIGFLNQHDAMSHEDRNLLSNCLGSNEMKTEIGSFIEMAPRDTLVLATDGLFDNLTHSEISNTVRIGNLSEKVAELARWTTDRMLDFEARIGKPDDLLIICFRLE